MAEPGHDLTNSHPPVSQSHFANMTEGLGLGFTSNLNAPLYEELAGAKRKHDGVQENARKVLRVHELSEERKQLMFKQQIEQKKIDLEKEVLMKKMAQAKAKADALAQQKAVAEEEAKIAQLQKAAREAAALRPAYVVKKLTEDNMAEIARAFQGTNADDDAKILEIIKERYPTTVLEEDADITSLELAELDAHTLSKIHDWVEAYYPQFVNFPSLPPAKPSVIAPTPTPDRQLAPGASTQREGSPTGTNPRNHKNLGVSVPAVDGAAAGEQPQVQTGGVASASQGTGRVDVNAINIPHPDADKLLEIHQNLKEFRLYCKDLADGNPSLKALFGNIRREITKRLNQLSDNSTSNAAARKAIAQELHRALHPKSVVPDVDLSAFLSTPVKEAAAAQPATIKTDRVPITFLYGLNMLSKAAFKKFAEECGSDPTKSNPVGMCLSSMFSLPELTYKGASLFSIVEAKFRKDLPVIFGVRGSEHTEEGRARLGWRRHKNADGFKGGWFEPQTHFDRMTGIAAGFASVALRDYSSVERFNPFPPQNWWFAMSAIVDTPDDSCTDTHFTVLRYIIDGWEDKIFNLFGDKGHAQLFTSLCVFPYKASNKTPAVHAIDALASKLKKEKGLLTLRPLTGHPPTPKAGQGFGKSLAVVAPPPRSPVFGPKSPMLGLHGSHYPLTPMFPVTPFAPSGFVGGQAAVPQAQAQAQAPRPAHPVAQKPMVQNHQGQPFSFGTQTRAEVLATQLSPVFGNASVTGAAKLGPEGVPKGAGKPWAYKESAHW